MQNVEVSLIRKILRRFIGFHDVTLNAETRQRTRWKQAILSASHAVPRASELKDADIIVRVTTSFFAVEIIGFFALDDDTILG